MKLPSIKPVRPEPKEFQLELSFVTEKQEELRKESERVFDMFRSMKKKNEESDPQVYRQSESTSLMRHSRTT